MRLEIIKEWDSSCLLPPENQLVSACLLLWNIVFQGSEAAKASFRMFTCVCRIARSFDLAMCPYVSGPRGRISLTKANTHIHQYTQNDSQIHFNAHVNKLRLYKCIRKITNIFMHVYVDVCLWIETHLCTDSWDSPAVAPTVNAFFNTWTYL